MAAKIVKQVLCYDDTGYNIVSYEDIVCEIENDINGVNNTLYDDKLLCEYIDNKKEYVVEKIYSKFGVDKDMKFDAIVGNPPYQRKADTVNIDIFSSAIFVRFNDMKNEIMRCVHECIGNCYRVFINCKADIESENEQKRKRDEQYSALLKELAEQEKAAAARRTKKILKS